MLSQKFLHLKIKFSAFNHTKTHQIVCEIQKSNQKFLKHTDNALSQDWKALKIKRKF